ncbi:hypothetical protein [Sphaerisporangium rufum]|uniref:hypothetical protein n=1 Tax=Sphaerisporangium rufum TaxID=1381558 RepID=UPI00194F5796|nr:hypothetical protein [Sphaerisporangium rufum]
MPAVDCPALLRALTSEEADVRRRELLFELALALGGTPALVLLRRLSPPEKDRLAAAVRPPGRVDAGTVEVIEKLTAHCRRLDDAHGPATVLPVVQGQRAMVAGLLRDHSLLPGLRTRLTHAYAQLGQLAGYLHYDLTDYPGAHHCYQDALTAAHEADDPALIAYLHICMSYVAVYQRDVGRALDHVFAAQGWAGRAAGNVVRSVHAMETARVLALDGRVKESERSLARAVTLAAEPRTDGDPGYLYWWPSSRMQSHTTDCLLAWGRLDDAIASISHTLGSPATPMLVRGQTLLQYADVLVRKKEIPEAVARIEEAAGLTGRHSSGRLPQEIRRVRARLAPWSGNNHVRRLDDRLHVLGIASATR